MNEHGHVTQHKQSASAGKISMFFLLKLIVILKQMDQQLSIYCRAVSTINFAIVQQRTKLYD